MNIYTLYKICPIFVQNCMYAHMSIYKIKTRETYTEMLIMVVGHEGRWDLGEILLSVYHHYLKS